MSYRSMQPIPPGSACSAVAEAPQAETTAEESHACMVADQPNMPESPPCTEAWEEGDHPEEADPLGLGFSLDD